MGANRPGLLNAALQVLTQTMYLCLLSQASVSQRPSAIIISSVLCPHTCAKPGRTFCRLLEQVCQESTILGVPETSETPSSLPPGYPSV